MADQQANQRLEQFKASQSEELKKLEKELELQLALPEDCPECLICVHSLYGSKATVIFRSEVSIQYLAETFKPLPIVKTSYGSTYKSFIADTEQCRSIYESKHRVTGWDEVGNYLLELSFLPELVGNPLQTSGEVNWFTLLGDKVVKIEWKMPYATRAICYSKVKHARPEKYEWVLHKNFFKSSYDYVTTWASIPGTNSVTIWSTDPKCSSLFDFINL